MLLDRRRVKAWQKWVFGFMALIMAAFLVMIPLRGSLGCGASSAADQIADDIAKYEAAVQADPNDVTAVRKLGDAYLARANQGETGSAAQKADWLRAIKEYEKAVAILAEREGDAAKQQRVEILEQDIVGVYLLSGDYQAAANVYPRIVKLTPKDAQKYFSWAEVAISAGDTGVAMLAFDKFLELDPDSPHAAEVKDWIKQNSK